MSDCDGDCDRCRSSSVFNELTDQAREDLVRLFAILRRRFERRFPQEVVQVRRRHVWDDWEYPYG